MDWKPDQQDAVTSAGVPRRRGGSNLQKRPGDGGTAREDMTTAQRSYLRALSDEAGEPFDEGLSKADASRRIDELQQRMGRGILH